MFYLVDLKIIKLFLMNVNVIKLICCQLIFV